MMDQYITLGDLLKICDFLLDLIMILYIYYNHKTVIRITTAIERNNRP